MNRSQTLVVVVTAFAALNFAAPAGAQPAAGPADRPATDSPPPAGGGRGFGRPTTLAEYQERQRERIMRADADHDGRVSLSEWTAYQAQRQEGSGGEGRGGHWGASGGDPTRQFQTMDANHDGYVTSAEIDAASAERFARMDANHDGVVTPDERRAMRGGGDHSPPPPQ